MWRSCPSFSSTRPMEIFAATHRAKPTGWSLPMPCPMLGQISTEMALAEHPKYAHSLSRRSLIRRRRAKLKLAGAPGRCHCRFRRKQRALAFVVSTLAPGVEPLPTANRRNPKCPTIVHCSCFRYWLLPVALRPRILCGQRPPRREGPRPAARWSCNQSPRRQTRASDTGVYRCSTATWAGRRATHHPSWPVHGHR